MTIDARRATLHSFAPTTVEVYLSRGALFTCCERHTSWQCSDHYSTVRTEHICLFADRMILINCFPLQNWQIKQRKIKSSDWKSVYNISITDTSFFFLMRLLTEHSSFEEIGIGNANFNGMVFVQNLRDENWNLPINEYDVSIRMKDRLESEISVFWFIVQTNIPPLHHEHSSCLMNGVIKTKSSTEWQQTPFIYKPSLL